MVDPAATQSFNSAWARWQSPSRPTSELVAGSLLLHLQLRHGRQWLSGPRARTPRSNTTALLERLEKLGVSVTANQQGKLLGLSDFKDLVRQYFFRGVVLDSHEGLLAYLEGRYPLTVRHTIPTPEQMLEVQCEGLRLVTLHLSVDEQLRPYGRHANACEFMLHDFEHAHKFYSDPQSFAGQVRFFRALRSTLPQLHPWRGDPQFAVDLNYLMSDMNSHPVHLMKYFKAVVLAAEIRRKGLREPELDGFWTGLFEHWQMPEPVVRAALNLNQPRVEAVEHQIAVANFFIGDSTCAMTAAVDR